MHITDAKEGDDLIAVELNATMTSKNPSEPLPFGVLIFSFWFGTVEEMNFEIVWRLRIAFQTHHNQCSNQSPHKDRFTLLNRVEIRFAAVTEKFELSS